ncbi:hypothetical protein BAU15_10575 [Enterococcus sp. JM4C]|uniref:helix-turn-helix domain-containing protein n=1 Tax=Candidatus Enterococcus huntleyi TaxID=1857217 RepID=UPI00137B7DB9|nr:helix-turn-helix domain-containing protein [Enterococcus sp. JM4C]KAF1296221.1 hypothetical protein BAU15_10575 [Enterococcus sp. JM4C]
MKDLKIVDSYFFSRPIDTYVSEPIEHRLVDSYEIEVITESRGGMYIDGEYYTVKKGDLIFRYPGQTTQGILPYSCYTLRFELVDELFDELAKNHIPMISDGEITKQIAPIIEDIFNEHISQNAVSAYFIEYQLSKLIYLLLYFFHPRARNFQKDFNVQNVYVSECLAYIQTNWQEVVIDDLVRKMGVSKPYLMKVFKKETGKTILGYIDETKINHIKKLLIFTKDSMTDIAYLAGFKTPSYFSNYVIKHTGMSPKQLRKKYTSISK